MDPDLRVSVLLLALCQALTLSGNVILVSTSALVGYAIAPDKTLATLPMACQLAAMAVSTVPASMIMKRLGRRVGFMIGASTGIAGGLLGAWSILEGQFFTFVAATMLVGVANAHAMYYRFAAADMVPAPLKAKAISWVVAGGIVAAILGPEIARATHDLFAGHEFAGTYFALACLPVFSIMLLGIVRIAEPVETDETRAAAAAGGRPFGEIFRQPAFPVALLGGMIGYGVMTFVMTATPLAMQERGFDFGNTAFVIQWHVLAMFAPSLVTGQIIRRVGVLSVMLAGVALEIACALINLAGTEFWHFWTALFCLGLGWNFLYVGSSSLLTECYRQEERATVQAVNEFSTAGTLAIASFSAGASMVLFGWHNVNFVPLPLLAAVGLAVLLLMVHRRRLARDGAAPGA